MANNNISTAVLACQAPTEEFSQSYPQSPESDLATQPKHKVGAYPERYTDTEGYPIYGVCFICGKKFPPDPSKKNEFHEWGWYFCSENCYEEGYHYYWDIAREAALKRAWYRCEGCGSDESLLAVHHIIPVRGGSIFRGNWLHKLNILSNLKALCWRCHGRKEHNQPRGKNTENTMSAQNRSRVPLSNTKYLSRYINKPILRGHEVKFPRPEMVFKRDSQLRGILLRLLGSAKKTEMVFMVLYHQAIEGEVFLKSRVIAGLASEKTWRRCAQELESQGLLTRERLIRSNGKQSVYLYDLRKLWELVLSILDKMLGPLKHWACQLKGSRLWIKVSGIWLSPLEVIKVLNRSGPTLAWDAEGD